jgi:hypothetical protein
MASILVQWQPTYLSFAMTRSKKTAILDKSTPHSLSIATKEKIGSNKHFYPVQIVLETTGSSGVTQYPERNILNNLSCNLIKTNTTSGRD